jgi:hypothetical protein
MPDRHTITIYNYISPDKREAICPVLLSRTNKTLVLRMGTPTEWNLPIGQPNPAPFLPTSKFKTYWEANNGIE